MSWKGVHLSLTPEDIQSKRFHDAFRGYSHEEVDVFLDEVSASFANLYQQVEAARHRVNELESRVSDVGATEGMLKRTLLAAQKAADDAVNEAKSEANRTLDAARSEAARTLDQAKSEAAHTIDAAQAQATQAVKEASQRAEDIVADANARHALLEEHVARLRSIESEHRATLRSHLESQLRALDELGSAPDYPVGPAVVSSGGWPPTPAPPPQPTPRVPGGTGPQARVPAGSWPEPGAAPQHAEGGDYEIIPQGSVQKGRPASSFAGQRRSGRSSPWSREYMVAPGDQPPGDRGVPEEEAEPPDEEALAETAAAPEPAPAADDGEEKSVRELFWGKS